MNKRPEVLQGVTYSAELESGKKVYITVNEHEGNPYEVFIRLDDPELFEWMVALTLMITRALRAGETLKSIAKELEEIYSPRSRHFMPGGKGECPSLAARIGKVLAEHKGLQHASTVL